MNKFGKTIVVTGAASGVGAELARQLTDEGVNVIGLDRKPPSASFGTFIELDLSQRDSIDRAVAQIEGPIDGLANVAGVADTLPKEIVYRVNFLGLRHLTEQLIGKLSPSASVVNVASLAGRRWTERKSMFEELLATRTFEEGEAWLVANEQAIQAKVPPYSFSKEAVIAYTVSRCCDFLPNGPRMNAICPGTIETPLLPDFVETMGDHVFALTNATVGRSGTATEIANAIAFLLSSASGWVKGQELVVDGGVGACITMNRFAAKPHGVSD